MEPNRELNSHYYSAESIDKKQCLIEKLFLATVPPDDVACVRTRVRVTNGNPEERREMCLEAHNYYRCLHGLAPLEYDEDLEESALDFADRLERLSESDPSVFSQLNKFFYLSVRIDLV